MRMSEHSDQPDVLKKEITQHVLKELMRGGAALDRNDVKIIEGPE